jgi:hypothetical protein
MMEVIIPENRQRERAIKSIACHVPQVAHHAV